jgi:hypothetical protein
MMVDIRQLTGIMRGHPAAIAIRKLSILLAVENVMMETLKEKAGVREARISRDMQKPDSSKSRAFHSDRRIDPYSVAIAIAGLSRVLGS